MCAIQKETCPEEIRVNPVEIVGPLIGVQYRHLKEGLVVFFNFKLPTENFDEEDFASLGFTVRFFRDQYFVDRAAKAYIEFSPRHECMVLKLKVLAGEIRQARGVTLPRHHSQVFNGRSGPLLLHNVPGMPKVLPPPMDEGEE
ncbi:MAG: hypothetical protein ABIA47_00470 [bacterium]